MSTKAQAWNLYRQEIIEEALSTRLLPEALKDTRQRLIMAAKEMALDAYAAAFWKLASTAPLRIRLPDQSEDGMDVCVEKPRLLSICWGPGGTTPTMGVALNEHGGLVDLLPCGQLSGNIPRSRPNSAPGNANEAASALQDPRKMKDLKRLQDKLFERRPHALVVGLGDSNVGQLMTDLKQLLDDLLDSHARWVPCTKGQNRHCNTCIFVYGLNWRHGTCVLAQSHMQVLYAMLTTSTLSCQRRQSTVVTTI